MTRLRFIYSRLANFARGVLTGALLVVTLNSLGHVISIEVFPKTIQMTAEAMR